VSTVLTSKLTSEDWEISDEPDARPSCVIVQLRQRVYVFPWFRFVYADGDNGVIQIGFPSHLVTVRGSGLAVLLAAISTQRVIRILQPTENEVKFGVRGNPAETYRGPAISEVTVQKYE
jgi:hypothetical protein